VLGTARRLEDTRRRSAPGAVLDGVELGDRGGGEAGALRRTLAEAARLSPRCGPPTASRAWYSSRSARRAPLAWGRRGALQQRAQRASLSSLAVSTSPPTIGPVVQAGLGT